jgi:hypothetical protein
MRFPKSLFSQFGHFGATARSRCLCTRKAKSLTSGATRSHPTSRASEQLAANPRLTRQLAAPQRVCYLLSHDLPLSSSLTPVGITFPNAATDPREETSPDRS